MAISLRDIVSFFVLFEKALKQHAPPGVLESKVRSVANLLTAFEIYSGCKYELKGLDFSEDLPVEVEHHVDKAAPETIWSLVLNYGERALILINTMERGGRPLVGERSRRFFAIKEAYHVVLRDEFLRQGHEHPDANSPEILATQAEELTFLDFSIVDFDSPYYPDRIKVEHSAELLAFFTLYEMDFVATDRNLFRGQTGSADLQDPTSLIASTSQFAQERKIPQRYVDLLFKWRGFDELYLLYRQLRDGYSSH